MPFFVDSLTAIEQIDTEQRTHPDVWVSTKKQGNRNLYVVQTRDGAAVSKMLNAQDMLDALKEYQKMCDCVSLAWKQQIADLINRAEGNQGDPV